jgi:hypothetical protein
MAKVKEKKMNKKTLWWGTGILVVLFLIVLDGYKIYKENEPPMPTVTIGDKKVNAYIKRYSWKGKIYDSLKPDQLAEQHTFQSVEPRSDMKVTFSEEPRQVMIGTWDFISKEVVPRDISGNTYYIDNQSGPAILTIEAEWEQGSALYIVPLEVEQYVTYQNFLAEEKDQYSLYCLVAAEEDHNELLNQPNMSTVYISDDIELEKKQHPDLKLEKVPTFILFSNEKEEFRTHDLQELLNYLQKINSEE